MKKNILLLLSILLFLLFIISCPGYDTYSNTKVSYVNDIHIIAMNWAGITPANLGNIIDFDKETASTEGIAEAVDNEGYINIYLDEIYNGSISVKMGVRMDNGTSATWRLYSSMDAINWKVLWESEESFTDNNEVIRTPSVAFYGKYLSISARNNGNGAPGLKVYHFTLE